MDKFQNKYRIPSNRMPRWDYSGNGIYFITLVTQNRECLLGKIVASAQSNSLASLQLSPFGKIVETEWLKSFEIRNELFLDEYIIMPNHLHAIIVLKNPGKNQWDDTNVAVDINNTNGSNESNDLNDTHVKTHGRASLQSTFQSNNQSANQSPFTRKSKSISSFIAGFKSAVNSKIDDYIDENNLPIQKFNRNNHFFQPNYHDHIIRDKIEYQRIKNYIRMNPSNWENDKFNSLNSNQNIDK